MFTIFSCPKPFRGHIDIIQRNAIKSWSLLRPNLEIILMGDEEGTAGVCKELGARHIPEIERNEYGTPLLNSVFLEAEKAANYDVMCYVNADIILMSNFTSAVKKVMKEMSKFLMVGRRWDLDVKEPMDFSNGWQEKLVSILSSYGKLHASTGIDFFVFPKKLYTNIPPFALGRTIWDNWLIYKIRSQRIPVVDFTPMLTIIHQNHDYAHCNSEDAWKGEEAKQNLALAGGYGYTFTIINATHKLTNNGLKHNLSLHRFYYGIDRFVHRFLRI